MKYAVRQRERSPTGRVTRPSTPTAATIIVP